KCCADRDQWRAPDYAQPLLVCPGDVECNLLAQKRRGHWAMFGLQFPAQPERHRNRGSRDKGFARARGVPPLPRDEGETPPRWPIPPTPAARGYGRSQESKYGHECERAGNTRGKMMDQARRLGSGDRPPPANWLLHS